MSKNSRITLLIIFALLILGVSLVGLIALAFSGFLPPSFHRTIIAFGPAAFLFLAIIFYVKLLEIAKNLKQISQSKEVFYYVICFVFILCAALPLILSPYIWCYEAQIRQIALLPGSCWYN